MFSFPDISMALGVSVLRLDPSRQATGISIDSRTLAPGDIFVALKGLRQDGHQYLEEAFQRGAAGALLKSEHLNTLRHYFLDPTISFQNLIPVPEPQKALADLARWHRARFSIQAVGITGSVGKTTTKEFLHYLIRPRVSALATAGNLNNHLGLPLTLLRLRTDHNCCVAELGASRAGEIHFLAGILKPTAGVITQISAAHLEGFESLAGIYEAKLELFRALPSGAVAVIPDDDGVLFREARNLRLTAVRVGHSAKADYSLSAIRKENSLVSFTLNGRYRFAFPGMASFFVRNAGMAVAMAEALGVPPCQMPEIWTDCLLPRGRFQERMIGDGILLIDDSYNASPRSFEKALEVFSKLEVSGQKILVFADMLELGRDEGKYHEELGKTIAQAGLDYVAAYGPRAQKSIEVLAHSKGAPESDHFSSAGELTDRLKQRVRPGDALLLKASRGMKIEEVRQSLEEWGASRKDREKAQSVGHPTISF